MAETTDNAFFEAVFVRALDARDDLEAALKARGYDRKAPRAKYDARVLVDCLEVARAHRYAHLDPSDGLRELGRCFVRGFRETIVGKVMTAALPILGPQRMLGQVPGRLQKVRGDIQCALEALPNGTFALTFKDPQPSLAYFFAGVVEAALGVAGATSARVNVTTRPNGYVLGIAPNG